MNLNLRSQTWSWLDAKLDDFDVLQKILDKKKVQKNE